MTTFVDFARVYGVDIDPSKLHTVDRIIRTGTIDKPRSKNGAFWWDGRRGWVCNWSTGIGVQWWHDPNAKPWTDSDKEAWRAKRDAEKRQREIKNNEAAARTRSLMDQCTVAEHGYLIIKGLGLEKGFVTPDNKLLVPMRDHKTYNLLGCQLIEWNEEIRKYEKKMTPGMRAKGAVYQIGPRNAPETCLVEGYATGLSVYLAMRSLGLQASVLVCFSAGNMEYIARDIGNRAYVFADNDKSKTGEETAKATGLPWCMSDVEGFDANDVFRKQGVMAVCKLLMLARKG